MGVVVPSNEEVLAYKGVHLFHSGVSNCSMRVRIALEEKGLEWHSHHLNILQKEHITPEYFGINPNGLVPTLVHDGVVIIESDDIIDYIDDQFPAPALKPQDLDQREQMYFWLHRAVEIHIEAVKTYIYFKRLGKTMAQAAEEDAKYRSLQSNSNLLDFHRKSSQTGFSDEDIHNAEAILDECFVALDRKLAEGEWIAGDAFSLADIAWVPLHFTLGKLAGYSFSAYPGVERWAESISQRASFKKGTLDWWPKNMGGN